MSETVKKSDIEVILETEGVNAKGYGLVSQAVMFDRQLSVTSKAIYAFFCSYLGAGRTIFPKMTTILANLKISENTYYKHFKPLVKNGYVKVSKAKGFLNKNVYTICNTISKLTDMPKSDSNSSLLCLDGINGKGYGFIPKLIMTDDRLSIKAKALIAFLYSLAQGNNQAYPHRNTICLFLGISKSTYYSALNEIISLNYITTKQRRGGNGKFSVTDYILNSNPDVSKSTTNSPCPKICGNGENGLNTEVSPCPKNYGNGENRINSKDSPCPKNCGNGKFNRVLKFEVLPCTNFCGNITLPENNISSNISSSNLKEDKVENIMLDVDDDAEITKNKILKLSRYDYHSVYPKNGSSEYSSLYRAIVRALINMLSTNEIQKFNKETVTRQRLIEFLNDCIEDDTDGKSLQDFILEVVVHYQICRKNYKIKRPSEYLKSLIWDDIKNYNLY